MKYISRGLIAVIAILHLYIAWFEIFAWTEVGPDVFSTLDPDLFAETVDLAANQGVYNLFLAAGLIWSLFISDPQWRFRVAICFLGFVAIAGIAAAATIGLRSGLPQLVPSMLALAATAIDHRGQAEVASATSQPADQ